MPNLLEVIAVALLGLILGSFLNVVILREWKWKAISTGRSKCSHCKKELRWFELIPVLSFLIQGGKCRRCHAQLSWQYPIVELLSAGVGVVAYLVAVQEYSSWVMFGFLVVSLLIFLAVAVEDMLSMSIDVSHSTVAGLIGAAGFLLTGNLSLINSLLGVLAGTMAIGAIRVIWFALRSEEGMGEGDIWIAGAIGAMLGYGLFFPALIVAVFGGAIIGVLAALRAGKLKDARMPFGPFLILGLLVSLYWGEKLIDWYLRLSGFTMYL